MRLFIEPITGGFALHSANESDVAFVPDDGAKDPEALATLFSLAGELKQHLAGLVTIVQSQPELSEWPELVQAAHEAERTLKELG